MKIFGLISTERYVISVLVTFLGTINYLRYEDTSKDYLLQVSVSGLLIAIGLVYRSWIALQIWRIILVWLVIMVGNLAVLTALWCWLPILIHRSLLFGPNFFLPFYPLSIFCLVTIIPIVSFHSKITIGFRKTPQITG